MGRDNGFIHKKIAKRDARKKKRKAIKKEALNQMEDLRDYEQSHPDFEDIEYLVGRDIEQQGPVDNNNGGPDFIILYNIYLDVGSIQALYYQPVYGIEVMIILPVFVCFHVNIPIIILIVIYIPIPHL